MAITFDAANGITFPNNTTQASAGVVLQVVNATASASTSTSSGTFVDTGFSASITPKFSTSKVLVMFSVFNMQQGGNMAPAVTIYRGSTNLDPNGWGFAQVYAATSSTITTGAGSGVILDNPATTSSTTYKMYFRNQNNNGTVILNGTAGVMSIVLMEIAG